jgi:hypothetical protein
MSGVLRVFFFIIRKCFLKSVGISGGRVIIKEECVRAQGEGINLQCGAVRGKRSVCLIKKT